MIYAVILFLSTYVLMIALPKARHFVALCAAALSVAFGFLPLRDVFSAIDWNILMMLSGTMITVSFFIESKMPNRIADFIMNRCHSIVWVTVTMSLFSGIVSAFIDNVATVLMIAPVALAICKKLDRSPVPMIIAIAVSSNLQGAATLVGDTTSIMLGSAADMNFNDFFFMRGRPGIFWAVELGALATVPILLILFRKEKERIEIHDRTEVKHYFPSVAMILTVGLLIAASFIPEKPAITNGLICFAIAILCMGESLLRTKSFTSIRNAFEEFDLQTVLLLSGLFVLIAGVENMGVIDEISRLMTRLGGGNLFLMYSIIVWGSVLVSAFVDNIPYVATMLPVVAGISQSMGVEPYLLFFGLLVGATLGGNLTPIGASANIAGIGILRKAGYEVKNLDFFRIGIPFTLAAVLTGYLYCWFIWA